MKRKVDTQKALEALLLQSPSKHSSRSKNKGQDDSPGRNKIYKLPDNPSLEERRAEREAMEVKL